MRRLNADEQQGLYEARGGPPDEPVVVYLYEPSRAARVAFGIIGDYQGYVQTDGYDCYRRPCAQPGIADVGCRVGGDVAIPTPLSPGRAELPHPVPHGRGSLAAA